MIRATVEGQQSTYGSLETMSQTSEVLEALTSHPASEDRETPALRPVTKASDVSKALRARQLSRKPTLEQRKAQSVHTKPTGLSHGREAKPVSIPVWARPINPPIQTTD